VLAAEGLIAELQATLPDWVIAVSTTTAAGQRIARERLAGFPVFYMPLDFAFAMRRILHVLQPRLVLLMESELWPRMLTECEKSGIPIAVVNARISDRSLPRYLGLRWFWKPLLAKVTLFLAQGDESAERLEKIGVDIRRIRVVGNLKYDAPLPQRNQLVGALRANLPMNSELVVCGSTLEGEETKILEAWKRITTTGHSGVLLIAPRHPQRFAAVARLAGPKALRVSEWMQRPQPLESGQVLVLDSVGDLASVYKVATVAFIGGSLVRKGGHNPLEAARFGVPVVMGPSYQNFREIVEGMRACDAIYIVEDGNLTLALHQAMTRGRVVGRRARDFFDTQTGATGRTVIAVTDLLRRGALRR
jgi:3-deoxy-D-manno-octulosonic-acid transferase